ncbi:hypothetical protein P280DRAFT_254183 [Massarina eburnea CBS 473.64]|uniref:Uncharacterized protein n=1 Tax=Massarina eburnea CBS 473.64 TaxID=1395130 RepID=A0A6A6S8E8_9PLEO|nr:hypothetical protein P280DRAFT_254183 [Massarina eburnea CBS 473.64]
MAPGPIHLSISRPTALYTPLSPYRDSASPMSLSSNLLCPERENTRSSSPPSPASVESFDILDSIAWRRGYTSYDTHDVRTRAYDVLEKRWKRSRGQIIVALLLFVLFVVGCSVGGWAAIRYEKGQLVDACAKREGGERCNSDNTWAKCVATNGVGYCEGIM